MKTIVLQNVADDPDQIIEPVEYDFGLSRRGFVQIVGAGLLIAVSARGSSAQDREGGRGRGRGGGPAATAPVNLEARLHIGKDGTITVMTGKVEGGQGARTQLTQAAAEELRLSPDRINLIMADTALCPDDGGTFGSRTTPATVPAVRQACAAARAILVKFAAKQWNVDPDALSVRDGVVQDASANHQLSYADLASADTAAEPFKQIVPRDVPLTKTADWKVLGTSLPRPGNHDLVRGAHTYPSDMIRPGMLYGKVLRAPSIGAKLTSVDTAAAKAMADVTVVQDGAFVAVAAATTYEAKEALRTLEQSAQWEAATKPSSKELFDFLRKNVDGGMPANPFADMLGSADKVLQASYHTAYIQHTPMEPRAAVAEWEGDKLTVWTASQNPLGVRRELANAFHIPEDRVRVIILDFGGGFGGKHTGETAIEAARLAQAAQKPVAVRWTRQEELTWAYFRPAALIDIQASLDAAGTISSWHFTNVNSGPSAVESPYKIARSRSQFVRATDPPLRHGSYRGLAATANNFARECFMDELAVAAGRDPLEFRLAHLENPRLRAVLEEAARRFGFTDRRASIKKEQLANVGVGLACGTEKGSFVATCAEVKVDRTDGKITIRRISQAFECGAITNPENLLSQVQGAIIMGLGPTLREAMDFDDRGVMRNASLWKYPIPRQQDVPELDIALMNRPDLPSVGAGETPLITVAPAVANAVFDATKLRLRDLPLRVTDANG